MYQNLYFTIKYMKLSRLIEVDRYELENWLAEELNLTQYQKDKLHRDEIFRFSDFYFYKEKPEINTSLLFRLTIIFIIPFIVLMFVILPILWIFTGKWGYPERWLRVFFYNWIYKLGL